MSDPDVVRAQEAFARLASRDAGVNCGAAMQGGYRSMESWSPGAVLLFLPGCVLVVSLPGSPSSPATDLSLKTQLANEVCEQVLADACCF